MKLTTSHLTKTALSLIISALLISSPGVAEDAKQKKDNQKQQYEGVGETDQYDNESKQSSRQIPKALTKLDLKKDQKEKIKESLSKHDKELQSTWKEFNQKHMQLVEMEAAWAAAVRDTLSEEDQKSFDEKRYADHKMMNKDKHRSKMKNDSSTAKNDSTLKSQTDDSETRSDRGNNQARRSENGESNERRDEAVRQASAEKHGDRSETASAENHADQQHEVVTLMIVKMNSPEKYAAGSKQTANQKDQCSKACREYSSELHSLWNEIHSLHAELVRIEAKRISSIEEVLTDEQLKKLRENRSEPENQTASR